jgi:hypothetical protein
MPISATAIKAISSGYRYMESMGKRYNTGV